MSNSEERTPQVRITISEVLSLLDQGKSRKEIAEHFGQTMTAMQKMVWSNPKLKNRKAKKQYSELIILEDDVEDVVQEVEPTVQDEVDVPVMEEPTVDRPAPTSSTEEEEPQWN